MPHISLEYSDNLPEQPDFKALFRQWAAISVKGFEELREMSPIPEDLEPGEKLKQ